MANTVKGQPATIAWWNDRPLVVLCEMDGHRPLHHGLLIGPEGMSYDDALARVDRAYQTVIAEYPDEWNYVEVIECLRQQNDGCFEQLFPAEWWEHFADPSAGDPDA